MMLLDCCDSLLISKFLLKFGRADNIGEHESQDVYPMTALKLFNLCPSLERYLLQFPDRHEHQSTKVSRSNQWENGSIGMATLGRFGAIKPITSANAN
jgi:hypothetical protein